MEQYTGCQTETTHLAIKLRSSTLAIKSCRAISQTGYQTLEQCTVYQSQTLEQCTVYQSQTMEQTSTLAIKL